MNNDTTTVRQINANSRRKFTAAAKMLPAEIICAIQSRVVEAINSGESHKATGGWIILPFTGKADVFGLLECASRELRAAQAKL